MSTKTWTRPTRLEFRHFIKVHRKQMGIYMIECLPTGKVYVGSSADVGYRIGRHLTLLRGGKHQNKYLQRTWNKYDENMFDITFVQPVANIDNLERIEEGWIRLRQSCDPQFGYNLIDKPLPQFNRGRKASQELRDKLKISNRDSVIRASKISGEKSRTAVAGYNSNNERVIEFKSQKEAIRAGYHNINRALKLPKSTCGGLFWKQLTNVYVH